MSFEDCACHVWAIDGYRNDDEAAVVNAAYDKCARSLSTANSSDSRKEALEKLLASARLGTPTKIRAKMYGGFRRGQKAPEHMWLEYDGNIYDTMPGYGLCKVAANTKNKTCPGLENDDFGTGAVCIDICLTNSQYERISAGEFIESV